MYDVILGQQSGRWLEHEIAGLLCPYAREKLMAANSPRPRYTTATEHPMKPMRSIMLTHWGRVTHIHISKLTIIGSDNGLSPGRRQPIIWTNDGILLIWTLGTNFSEILIEIRIFSFKKIGLKVTSGKRRPFCLGLNVLTWQHFYFSVCVLVPAIYIYEDIAEEIPFTSSCPLAKLMEHECARNWISFWYFLSVCNI